MNWVAEKQAKKTVGGIAEILQDVSNTVFATKKNELIGRDAVKTEWLFLAG